LLFFPTADEDFKYFRDHGYDGSINDMHYKALGDLGYTGSLNDRTHAYLTAVYGSFYEAMRDLRNGTSAFALYSVNKLFPPLVLDFKLNIYKKENALTTLSSAVTHVRASSATMTNSSGTIVTVGNNVPRIGHHVYNGSTWVNEGILLESEARTNLITYSSDFTDSSYSKSNVTIGGDNIVAPDGTTTADTVTATGSSYIQAALNSADTSIEYTLSVWMKVPSGTTSVDMGNIDAGVYITKTVTTDWQLFSITQTPSATTRYPRVFRKTSGDVTVHIWGAQLEAGSTASSYIPTSGSTATRAAETLIIPAANLPYNSTNMSIQIDGRMTYSDIDTSAEAKIYHWYEDSLNNIYTALDTRSTRTGQVDFYQENGGVVDLVQGSSTSYSPGILVPFNLSSRHGATFLNGAIDGTALTANTTPSALPDLSSTNLDLGKVFMGTIAQFRMWDEDLTDAGIEKASE